jgi:hypothetical protein
MEVTPSASRWARRRRGLIPFRRRRLSGLHPAEPRRRRGFERQRLAAVEHVRSHRGLIRAAAGRHDVAAEAIAGAILWDALENPYKRPFLRLGPGKVRPSRLGGPSAAESAERAGLVPFSPASTLARWRLLHRPDSAIVYIAAILARHAADYREIAGVEIGDDPAVLCTLYQGGRSEERAQRLAARRRRDSGAMPRAADEMGPWVAEHMGFVRAALDDEEHSPPQPFGRAARYLDLRAGTVRPPAKSRSISSTSSRWRSSRLRRNPITSN